MKIASQLFVGILVMSLLSSLWLFDVAGGADDEVFARGDEPGVGEAIEPHDTRVEGQHEIVAG